MGKLSIKPTNNDNFNFTKKPSYIVFTLMLPPLFKIEPNGEMNTSDMSV